MPSPASLHGPVAYPRTVPQGPPETPYSAGYSPRNSPEPGPGPRSDHLRHGTPSPVAGSSSFGTQGKSQTVFIHKLFDMLEDASLSHLIWWLPTQDSFCLYPGEEFLNVLAQYFKHTNIASFIRQLNMYGFHKVNDNFQSDDKQASTPSTPGASADPAPAQQTRWEFRHSANHFRKGDVESLSLIKRKSSKVISLHKEIVSLKTLPPTSHAPLDDQKPLKDAAVLEQYGSAAYAQAWAAPPRSKDHARVPPALYGAAAPGLVPQYNYSVYPPPGTLPHSPSSPRPSDAPSQLYFLQHPQPPVGLPAQAADHAWSYRLAELAAAVHGLQAAYLDLLARHESLAALHSRGRAEVGALRDKIERMEALERHERTDRNPNSDEPRMAKDAEHRSNTPVGRVASPGADGTSPTSVPVPKSLDAASRPTSQPGDTPKARTQGYHLSSARAVPSAGIVPQLYPLNPNYTLYNSEAARALPADELRLARPSASRQVSVLMDPLQPAPGGSHSTPGTSGVSSAPSVPGASGTSGATAASNAHSVSKPDEPYVQQYQPFAPAHAYYQHMVHDQSHLRTTSLPVMLHPLPQQLALVPQRHLMNLLVSERENESRIKTPGSENALKKTLPSMEELNKSLRSGSPLAPLFGLLLPDEESLKRRKIEEE